ncbi:MAG: hypothetical protein ACN6NT_11180, partial [Comamonas sp.]
DSYSLIATLLQGGGGGSSDFTMAAVGTAADVATGLVAAWAPTSDVTITSAGNLLTVQAVDGDKGGFTLLADSTAGFGGSGASNIGATNYLTADVITDFTTGEDTISFGLQAGVAGSNYLEVAGVDTYATALTNANAAFNGTVQYYLTSAADLDGVAGTGQVENNAEGAGLLFIDANLDGNVDAVVLLLGVTSDNFAATDIVA